MLAVEVTQTNEGIFSALGRSTKYTPYCALSGRHPRKPGLLNACQRDQNYVYSDNVDSKVDGKFIHVAELHSKLNYALDQKKPGSEILVKDGTICLTRSDLWTLGLPQCMESNVADTVQTRIAFRLKHSALSVYFFTRKNVVTEEVS
ncbi:hypothetical protein WMY93_000266 [Mugilogobius chulae]|uniref:Transferrin n=1 Tax=Mugilogobius chulae TaxID=88201 RepID=A0AAW0Q727_9GOBI